MTDSPRSRILLFLLLELVIGSTVYAVFLTGGRGGACPRLFAGSIMGSPGLSALLTRGILQGSLRGGGWGPGPPRFLVYAYLLPLALEGPVYAVAWKTGLAGFQPAAITRVTAHYLGFATAAPASSALLMGEELGWRGLLVPELARVASFRTVSLASGGSWALFHYPAMVFGGGTGLPLWYALPMFSLTILLASHVFTWLRLASGSVWPCVVLHAAHNAFLIGLLGAPTFANGPGTRWIVGESGCGLALAYGVAALFVIRHVNGSGAARGPAQEIFART
jgi:membrane protease YdiL (CAAX protease family)